MINKKENEAESLQKNKPIACSWSISFPLSLAIIFDSTNRVKPSFSLSSKKWEICHIKNTIWSLATNSKCQTENYAEIADVSTKVTEYYGEENEIKRLTRSAPMFDW